MRNISIDISGNLTGFSGFYTSPSAVDILKEVKFDFDYRNYLTFLNEGEKAYAISFAQSVLAVSLVTRILDSFRRPGVLVVTVLLPRCSKVELAMNPQDKNALYKLLNEINDKFYEKNFVNGMVNQNAAVLMQDYYSDIVAKYALVPDGMQRKINETIDVTSVNKRLGYVKTIEDDVPLYLSTPCRRSYEGCHLVFFVQNPIQNLIAEDPVELVLYKVKITNNNHIIPSVKLSDRIYNLQPDEGEIDIDKNFTYQQVINGDAGRNIVADVHGENIDITYRFGQEEKTITFLFSENGKNIPFTSIMPVLEFNGTYINIPSETFTFQGKEIYDIKKIKSRGSDYIIKRGSEQIDLRRLHDTCIVEVESCFTITALFNQPEDNLKRITFINNSTGVSTEKEVTNRLEVTLPGKREDYSYTIESHYYERVTGSLPASGAQIQFPRLMAKRTVSAPVVNNLNRSKRPTVTSGAVPKSTLRQNDTKTQQGGVHLNSGTMEQKPKPKPDPVKEAMPYVAGLLGLCLIYITVAILADIWPFSGNDKQGGNAYLEQMVYIYFNDCEDKPLMVDDFAEFGNGYFTFKDLLEVIPGKDLSKSEQVEDNPEDSIFYVYKVNVPEGGDPKYEITVQTKEISLGDKDDPGFMIKCVVFNNSDDEFGGSDSNMRKFTIKLDVKTSELKAYKKALASRDRLSPQERDKITKVVYGLQNDGRCEALANRIKLLIPDPGTVKVDTEKNKQNEKKTQTGEAKKTASASEHGDSGDTGEISEAKNAQQELEADIPGKILSNVNNGNPIVGKSQVKDLTDTQKEVIKNYNKWLETDYKKMDKNELEDKYDPKNPGKLKPGTKTQLKNVKTFKGLQNVIKSYKHKQ